MTTRILRLLSIYIVVREPILALVTCRYSGSKCQCGEKVEKVREGFYIGVAKLAHPEKFRLKVQQAMEMRRRILSSFASRPDGGELADGFVAVIEYFSGVGYWRGYKNAKKHDATLNSDQRPPRGSEKVRLAIQEILEQQPKLPTKGVCELLDKKGLSESFEFKKGKQRFLNVGRHRGKVQHSWVSVCRENCVKKMISRIRTRLRRERNADAWMKLADGALESRDEVSSKAPRRPVEETS